jgi:hypothetical protein
VKSLHHKLSLCALALIIQAGCAVTGNDLTMTSDDRHRDFSQTFSHAYAALNDNGDYDVVLVHDANADAIADAGGPIQPGTPMPRQVVHIRVFWLAESGTKFDHPTAANAAMRWFVFGDRAVGSTSAPENAFDVLEYSGSALVLVHDDGRTASVVVRGASLKPVARRGQMSDPLGPSSVTGSISARVDRGAVDELLRELKEAEQANAPGVASR